MKQSYLIQITIGPVQDFIASARKLRDLWFGSYMLSELSKTVARSLHENQVTLVFPHVADGEEHQLQRETSLLVANKILGEVVSADPASLVDVARKAWVEHRLDFARQALSKIQQIKQLKINETLFRKQMLDSGEFYAAWVPLHDDYASAKKELEKLMAGRKNLREFSAPGWVGEGIPKNSFDGLREAVTGDNQIEIQGLLKKNERLDALACTKRFGALAAGNKNTFDDLASLALLPWIEGVQKIEKMNILNDSWKSNAEDILEGGDYLREIGIAKDFQELKKMVGDPGKYACIMVGDGDHMGVCLDSITTGKGHRIFSKYLGEFAGEVGKVVAENGGSLIYSGGDDVMACLPLHTVLECADQTRELFGRYMHKIKDALRAEKISLEKLPTFSAGVAIVHYKEPLDRALKIAREAERQAKEEGGRNAVAIVQRKRNGTPVVTCGKWNEDKDATIDRLNTMIMLCAKEYLPSTLAYQLRQVIIQAGDFLVFESSNNDLIPKNAASTFVLDIFRHKEHNDILQTCLLPQHSVRKLSDEMIIARQLYQAHKTAQKENICVTS